MERRIELIAELIQGFQQYRLSTCPRPSALSGSNGMRMFARWQVSELHCRFWH